MKNNKRLLSCGVWLVLLLCAISPAFAAAQQDGVKWPSHLRLLTGPQGGQWWSLGEPIAEIFSKNLVPTTARIGGGLGNIDAVNARQADVAFTLACFLAAAASGEKEYQNIKVDTVELLANIYPQVFYVLLRKDFADKNGITDVQSLFSKELPLRFATLKPGTASEFILRLVLRYGYNSGYDKLRSQGWTIEFNNYAETADNFVAGNIDCFAYTAGTIVPLIRTMEEHIPVTILPISETVLQQLAQKFNMHKYVINPGTYQGVKEPVATLGDFTTLIVRKDLPNSLVYGMAKALWEGRESIASVVQDFGALSGQSAISPGLSTHPGALEFWQSLKP